MKISPIVILGGAAAAYLLLNNSSTAAPGTTATSPLADALTSLLPGASAVTQVPTTYGINSGVRGGNGSFYTCANYDTLAAVNPNLLNPKYSFTAAENAQYLANYLDLQQGLATWVGQKMVDPRHGTAAITIPGLSYASNLHWYLYGCAQQRIFLPLQPPSNLAYIPPPPAPKSSGGGLFSTILKAATIVAGGVVTVATGGAAAPLVAAGESAALTAESAIKGTTDERMNDRELELLFQGAAVLYDILPLYQNSDPLLVTAIKTRLDQLLKQYA